MESREIHNNFILEYKQEQEFKKRYKQNFIELDDYFKYSGKVEKSTDEYSIYENKINKFDKFHNKNRDKIIKKIERYEKIIKRKKSIENKKYRK
jgi:IS1 family transposase